MRKCWLIFVCWLFSVPAVAQFYDCTSGLLQSPTAEMQEAGTFMITNNFLNEHTLPQNNPWWGYNTFSYGFDITFFSRLEIAYICTLYRGSNNGFWPQQTWGRYTNQDRHFAAKLQLLKESEFGVNWLPAIAVGFSDPITNRGGSYTPDVADRMGNGYFNRFYAVASKHFKSNWGDIGAHIGYQYNLRQDIHYNAPCVGIDWRPVWLRNRWFDPKFVLEYDARTPNIGFIADIWDDRFEAMFCLQNFQWVSFGLRFKLHLKGAD